MATTTFPTPIDMRVFDSRKDEGTLKVEHAYSLRDSGGNVIMFAWTPDGVGAYYYDTLAELMEQHG